MGSTILTNVSKYLPGFFIGTLLKDILTFTFLSLICSENVKQKTAASFTICICEEFSHNMNSLDQILGRVPQFFHQSRYQRGERMRGGTGSGSFYNENVHTGTEAAAQCSVSWCNNSLINMYHAHTSSSTSPQLVGDFSLEKRSFIQ